MLETLKAYLDLLRIQFFFVWPLLFLSGTFLSFSKYGSFDWLLVAKAFFIGLFGFEAGLVLNDYIDRDLDRIDLNHKKLTKYWRLFKKRPLAEGKIPSKNALMLFFTLVTITGLLILTLPPPHSYLVFALMLYCYCMEAFSQIKKRSQSFPLAQLIGRTDFTLFPIAGYLVNGQFDGVCLMYIFFFYPYAQAHLIVSDIVDVDNDEARGLKTIPLLYGLKYARLFVLGFTLIHIFGAIILSFSLGTMAFIGLVIGGSMIVLANFYLLRDTTPENALKIISLFHIALISYATSMILSYFF